MEELGISLMGNKYAIPVSIRKKAQGLLRGDLPKIFRKVKFPVPLTKNYMYFCKSIILLISEMLAIFHQCSFLAW